MSALDDALGTLEIARKEQSIIINHMLPAARAELAQLHTTIAEFEKDRDVRNKALSDILAADKAIIAKQTRQLEEARDIISQYHIDAKIVTPNDYAARAWLAALQIEQKP